MVYVLQVKCSYRLDQNIPNVKAKSSSSMGTPKITVPEIAEKFQTLPI